MTVRVVCLDTNVLVWGLRRQATEGQEDMIPRAERFLRDLVRQEARVIVPAVVVAELLLPVEADDRLKVLNYIAEHFQVAPLDIRVAARFAQMWGEVVNAEVKRQHGGLAGWKTALRADAFIVATAICNRAEVIYSHEGPSGHIRQFADGRIAVHDIPDLAEDVRLPFGDPSNAPHKGDNVISITGRSAAQEPRTERIVRGEAAPTNLPEPDN